jgi:hypothetical protein
LVFRSIRDPSVFSEYTLAVKLRNGMKKYDTG